jgi:hypothetical protein
LLLTVISCRLPAGAVSVVKNWLMRVGIS